MAARRLYFMRRIHRPPLLRFTLSVIVIVLLGGCVSHVKELRDAQDQFSMAASLENQSKLDPRKLDAAAVGSITTSYRISLATVSGLIDKNKGDLEKDKLLGVAFTLKALTEWRLGEYGAADQTLNEAKNLPEGVMFPRDLALLDALRGLIKNDQAYRQMVDLTEKRGTEEELAKISYKSIKSLLEGALADIDKGMRIDSGNDNLRLYFLVCKLAALKNWKDLRGDNRIEKIDPESEFYRTEKQEWCNQAETVWKNFKTVADKLSDSQDVNQLKDFWERQLNLGISCQK